jgi:hypothetical protein
MLSILLTIGALAVVGIVGPLVAMAAESQSKYGSDLENYIVSHNPQDTGDVERLAQEYNRKLKEGFL